MARQHNINGIKVPFTAEEEAQADIERQAWLDGAFDREIVKLRDDRNRLLTEWKKEII